MRKAQFFCSIMQKFFNRFDAKHIVTQNHGVVNSVVFKKLQNTCRTLAIIVAKPKKTSAKTVCPTNLSAKKTTAHRANINAHTKLQKTTPHRLPLKTNVVLLFQHLLNAKI